MSDRSNWVPLAAGVAVGAGLLVVLYKMFFSNTGSYSKTFNQNIGAAKYTCTCRKGGIDAEELERRKRAPPIPPSAAGRGWGGEGKSWMPVLGGAATLLAIIALLYKSFDTIKALIWKTDTCGETFKKRKREPEITKPCICKD